MQTEVALSTTEAKYIALAQALREFIPMQRAFEDMIVAFDLTKEYPITVKSTIFEDNNGAISTATTTKMISGKNTLALNIILSKIILLRNATQTIILLT